MADDPLTPVFIPALIVLLAHLEKESGRPLTEGEVLSIRDNGTCVMMPTSKAIELDTSRGYNDIDPEKCWEQWLEHKANEQSA
jgi:hypothetical protein